MFNPDVIADAAAALADVQKAGIEVMQGWFNKDNNKCHATLWDLGEEDENHSDDVAEGVRLAVQVTIFSRKDELTLARRVKELMLNAGFDFEGRNADDSQPEDGIYMKAQRFSKFYENEEEINK